MTLPVLQLRNFDLNLLKVFDVVMAERSCCGRRCAKHWRACKLRWRRIRFRLPIRCAALC